MGRLEVLVSGRFLVARVEDGALVVDEESRSIFELCDAAADAFDVLVDARADLPSTERTAAQIRRLVQGLRREMFGEQLLGPHESVGIDGPNGELLFRRYPEPGHWRGKDIGFSERPDVRGALVRHDRGAVLLLGRAGVTTGLAHAFGRAGLDAVGRDDIRVASGDGIRFRSSIWGEAMPALEVWSLDVAERSPHKVTRHSPMQALLRLTREALSRPNQESLWRLASCAQGVPNFGLAGPSDIPRMAETIARYQGILR